MRKLFASAAIALAMLFQANTAQAGIQFGLKGGVNVTSMSIDSKVLDANNRTGFFIGPTVKFTLPIVGLGIDASVLYDQREAKVALPLDESNNELPGSKSLKRQSIEIPINLRYGIGLGSLANIFFFAGPQFGFNVGDKTQEINPATEWKLKSSQFSVNVGAGVTLINHLQLSANYNIACGRTGDLKLANITKNGGRTNAWQIGLAYYF